MKMFFAAVLAASLLALPVHAQDPGAEPQDDPSAEPQDDPGTTELLKIDFTEVLEKGRAAWVEPEGSTADEATIKYDVAYTLGFFTRVLYHEFGHGIVMDFKLPVMGKEEDAVDSLAVLTLLDDEDPAVDEMLEAVLDVYFDFGEPENIAWDQHSMPEQRAYAVLCLLVGDDPEGYKQVADDAGMPAERQANCKYEYQKTRASWETVLADNLLPDTEPPTTDVTIVYQEPKPEFAIVANLIKSSGLAEAVAWQMENRYRLPGPVTISFDNCGEVNALYHYDTRTVQFCYEYAELVRSNAIKFRTAEKKPDPKPTDEELNKATGEDDDDAATPK